MHLQARGHSPDCSNLDIRCYHTAVCACVSISCTCASHLEPLEECNVQARNCWGCGSSIYRNGSAQTCAFERVCAAANVHYLNYKLNSPEEAKLVLLGFSKSLIQFSASASASAFVSCLYAVFFLVPTAWRVVRALQSPTLGFVILHCSQSRHFAFWSGSIAIYAL